MPNEEETITIQKKWLEGLVAHADKVKGNFNENVDQELKYWLKFGVPSLIGHISSAKWILGDEDIKN